MGFCVSQNTKQTKPVLTQMSNYFKRYHATEDLFKICMYVCVPSKACYHFYMQESMQVRRGYPVPRS